MLQEIIPEYAENYRNHIATEIAGESHMRAPSLTIFNTWQIPASMSYIKSKTSDCNKVGITCTVINYVFSKNKSPYSAKDGLIDLIKEYSKTSDGVMVQLPLHPTLAPYKQEILNAIDDSKDVDGLKKSSTYVPCTPAGIINFLNFIEYNLAGKNALIIGRSELVGKPLANLMLSYDATVTVAHSKTEDIRSYIKQADIIITAIDRVAYYEFETFEGTNAKLIIDVGLGKDKNNKLCGNMTSDAVDKLRNIGVRVISGKGGVGLLTRVALLSHVVNCWKNNLQAVQC